MTGDTIRNFCRWSESGHQITTDYQVKVKEVIKGNVNVDSVITVRMPGGLMMERDGSILNVRAQRIRNMLNGKRYVMFLKNAAGSGDAMMPLRGSQGLFEVTLNGLRVLHTESFLDISSDQSGEELPVFLQKIRELMQKSID